MAFKDKSDYIASFHTALEKCMSDVASAKACGEDVGQSPAKQAHEREAASSLVEVCQVDALSALCVSAAQVCAYFTPFTST